MADIDPRVGIVQFPFSGGIDEASRDEIVDAGQGWPVLENGRQDHRGGYSTRLGFDAQPVARTDATTPTAGHKMFADRNSIVRITEALQAESFSYKAQAWTSLGRVPEATSRLIDLPSMGIYSVLHDIDATNGYVACSWLSYTISGSVHAYVVVIDQATGATVRAPERVGSTTVSQAPFLGVQGNYLVMVRANGATVDAWYLDTTSAATITTGWVAFGAALAADCSVIWGLHSLPHASTPRIAILYTNNSGGLSRLTLKTFNVGGVVQTQTVDTNTTSPGSAGIGGNATDTLWLVWSEATVIRARGVSPFTITTDLATKATVGSATTIAINTYVAAASTAGKARYWFNDTTPSVQAYMRGIQTTAGAAATDGAQVLVPGLQMIRRPFSTGGRYYSAFRDVDTPDQQNFVVCDWTADTGGIRPVANPAPGISTIGIGGGILESRYGKFVAGTTATTFLVGLGLKRSAIADGTALAEISFADPNRWQTAAHGNSTALAGGVPSQFDGVRVAEIGFLHRPATPFTQVYGTGITAATGWRYIAVFEETDSDGNWHVSGLSNPSVSTGAVANKTVGVQTWPLAMTSRLAASGAESRGVRVAWYRTLDGGVAPYYRLGATVNDATTHFATWIDLTTDATLALASKLYSQPGVLNTNQDHRPPPSFGCIVSYNGMLVGASGSSVWSSGQDVVGEGTWFSPIWQVPVPGDGDITAMFAQDGTLFVCKRRDVYAMNGEPPADNATSGGMGFPRRLSVDVGAISPVTCATAMGTFYQSDRGIELMTRSQSVEWIGEGIQDTLAAYPIVTSMTLDPRSCTVLIELAASTSGGLAGGSGRTLVYDLSLRGWISTDRRTSSAGVADVPSQSACMVYTGTAWRYAWLGTNGVSYTEAATYLDATYWIAKRAVSGWVKAAGLQGTQHVNKALLLAKNHTAHDVSMSFAYNYSPTYQTARLYTATQIGVLTALIPNVQLEHGMHDDARCESVRIQLVDATPSTGEPVGTGQAGTWVALAFEAVPQQGAFMLPDEAK